jgi:hypothetical protein
MNDFDSRLLTRIAAARPAIAALSEPEIEHAYSALRARLVEPTARGSIRQKRVLIAAVAAVVLLVPTIAVAARTHFFGLSNPGTPVPQSAIDAHEASGLDQAGFAPELTRLGERAGLAFYVARSRTGGYCFAISDAAAPTPHFGVAACQNDASAFPSPAQPIVDLSPLMSAAGSRAASVQRLEGFASDDVAAVEVLDLNGGVIAKAVVSGNFYATERLPEEAASAIVAMDANGSEVFRRSLLRG